MTIEIVPAGPADVEVLAALLARSFLDDPQIRWPLPAEDLEWTSTEMFRLLVEGYTHLGFVWRAVGDDGGSIGCTAWLPPGRSDELAKLNQETTPRIDALTHDGGARYHVMWTGSSPRSRASPSGSST